MIDLGLSTSPTFPPCRHLLQRRQDAADPHLLLPGHAALQVGLGFGVVCLCGTGCVWGAVVVMVGGMGGGGAGEGRSAFASAQLLLPGRRVGVGGGLALL